MDRRLEPADHDRNLAVAEPGRGGVANAVRRSRFTVVDGLFLLLIGFAVFNIPVVWIGEDSIGFFDLYLIFFLVTYLTLERLFIPPAWRIWFWAGAALLAYLLIDALLTQQPRGMLIVLKLAESVLGRIARRDVLRPQVHPGFDRYHGIYRRRHSIDCLSACQSLRTYLHSGHGPGIRDRVVAPDRSSLHAGYTARIPRDSCSGCSSCYSWICRSHRRPVIKLALYILLVTALLLTVSRTNIIALAAVIAFRFALKAISGERFLLIFLIITVLVVVMFVVLTTIVARDSVLWKVLQIVVNPQGIFSINSFWLRYALLWPTAINAWLGNAGTLLFGLGIGFMATVDGTIPWLLANTGITGLALFTLFWYGALLKRWPGFRTVRLLLLFTLINLG